MAAAPGPPSTYDAWMEPAVLSLQLIEASNRRDVPALARLLSPVADMVRPGRARYEGLAEVLARMEADWEDDVYLQPKRFVRQEEAVVAEVVIGPARRSLGPSVDAVEFHRWSGGLLVESRRYVDTLESTD